METTPLPSVREHADSLIADLMAKRPPAANIEEARQAAAIPAFSSGTTAIGSDGKPVDLKVDVPEFTGAPVAMPDAGDKAELLKAHQALLDAKAGATAAPSAAKPTEAAVAPAAAPAGDVVAATAGQQSAEAAAQEIVDEYDEFEWTDPDLDVPIPIRVPKQFVETVKRGYGRRAALDRAINFAKQADPALRGLIESGQMQQVLPLLQRALTDTAYGEYVTRGYQRAQAGLPLIEQAKAEAEAAAAPAQAPAIFDPMVEDPYYAERLQPLVQKIETLEQRYAREDAQRQEQAQRQQREQALVAQRDAEFRAAHQDIANAYPQNARLDLGPGDPLWNKAVRYAKEAGYIEAYGPRAGVVFGAQMAMQVEAERLAATGSPAAEALRMAEQQHGELARREAAAASRAVGGGSSTPAPKPAPPAPPNPRTADGKLKPAAQFLRESQSYIAASR
jgi:hypothetical protein